MFMLEEFIKQDFGLQNTTNRFSKSVVHDSLVLDRQKKIFYWNSRGIVGDAYVYLTQIRGLTDAEAREIGVKNYNYIFDHAKPVEVTGTPNKIVPYPPLVDIFYEYGNNLENKDYWYNKRGYTDETISNWKLGFTGEWHTIPVYVEGNFVNFQLRKETPKLINYWYKNVGPHPFNFSIMNVTNFVVITEGPPDCIILRQNKIPAVSHTGGSGYWNIAWNKWFLKMKTIYICYDNDAPGIRGAKNVAKWFGYKIKLFNWFDFPPKYDATDFFNAGGTREEFMDLLLTQSKYYYEVQDVR